MNTIKSLNHLIADRAQNVPDTFVLGVPNKDFVMRKYTVGELNLSATLLAHHFERIGVPTRARGDSTTRHTVALLAPSNYHYVVTELALARMGLGTLFVSINNSPAAIAHLLSETRSTHLILHPQYTKVAEEGIALLPPGLSCTIVPTADHAVYGPEARKRNPHATWTPALSWEEESRTTAYFVHSSGSKALAANVQSFNTSVFVTLPLYHYAGHSCFWRGMHLAKPVYLFPASDFPLTPTNVISLLKLCDPKPEAIFAVAFLQLTHSGITSVLTILEQVPHILKHMAESQEGIDELRSFSETYFAGSAMPDEIGDRLVAQGVNVVGLYLMDVVEKGTTETGSLMTSRRDFATDKAWAYSRISPAFAPFCLLEPRDGDTFELICRDGWPKKVVSNREDGSYATKDIFVKHPTIPVRPTLLQGYFVGRIDDTLVLTNGEKVNPVPMEAALKTLPVVAEAIVFGAGHSQTGALVLLAEFVNAEASRADLLKLIESGLKKANTISPTHAEITPEMVIFLPHGTHIAKADKGSIIRDKVYKAFAQEIDEAYKRLIGEDGISDEEKKKVGSAEEMEQEVLGLVSRVASGAKGITAETDLFTAGLDSLQAGRIRNSLQREYNFGGKKLPTNLVFDYPTVRQLVNFVVAFAHGDQIVTLSAHDQMLAYVEKYRHFNVPQTAFEPTPRSGHVVVLTGATGSLGSQLLHALLAKDNVKKVYALVRAKNDTDAAERVAKSMKGEFDPRVVGLASDFASERLGLSSWQYDEIAKDVTLVLHNAWSNLNISSFEPHILGACNLMKLCLESGPVGDFYFDSSISAIGAWPGPDSVPERVTDDTSVSLDMGYGQSKWVMEKLCEIATHETPLRAVVLRIGQMVGSSVDGKWNETEAVSLMIKSAQTIKALPALKETVSWLPVDYAALVILELSVERSPPPAHTSECWHIVQAKRVSWSDILSALRANGLEFETVEPVEWLRRLRAQPDPEVNPTIKLLSFYESEYDVPATDAPAPKWFPLDTTQTAAASRFFREAPYPNKELIGKFVQSWRKSGFLV
ncbi:hypothetical protein P7C70_g1213, partial [Phenoliferia sp. Uapishka_3]